MSQPLPPDFAPFQSLEQAAPPPRRKRSGLITVLLTLVLLLAVAVLLNESVLVIRYVDVKGNRTVSKQEVTDAAGLNKTINYFALNEEKVAQGVNSHRYLIYQGLEKHFPDTVTLYVQERVPAANVKVRGIFYLIDSEGMVLERSDKNDVRVADDLMTVTGFKGKDMRVGRVMVSSSVYQMDAYLEVMKELTLQDFAGQVSELNLTNPDSLYLLTVDGYTIHLGGMEDLRAKIGTVRAVVDKLREMGLSGGVLEASVPEEVTYSRGGM